MIKFLLEYPPNWFFTSHASEVSLSGTVVLPQTIWNSDGIEITITSADFLKVGETTPGTKLPKFCYERHILPDSTFCLALWGFLVGDLHTTRVWWEQLRQFLVCQSVAHETGIWPVDNSLDHGRAGRFHERALKIAAEIGILDEYNELHQGLISSFRVSTLARLAPNKRHRIKKLIAVDKQRREALDEFNCLLTQKGATCCGTMRECPLPKRRLVQESMDQAHSLNNSTALCSTMGCWVN